MKILILGGGLQALCVSSSLRKKDNFIAVVSDDLMVTHSRFFDKVYNQASCCDSSVLDILKRDHYDVLFPMGDKPAVYLSQNKESIESTYGVKCAVPDYSEVSIVENKSHFMDFCEKHGFPHPKTLVLKTDLLDSCVNDFVFPALIKPDVSVGSRGITRVNNVAELKAALPNLVNQYGSCSLQEYIDNDEYYYNVMIYRDRSGECKNHTIIKILRHYPIAAGSSSCCVSVENQELFELCRNVLDRLNWVGMADFDVLQRLDNGEYKIIEINPRVPASLRAASISGVNFAECIVNDACGRNVELYDYKPGKTLRYLGIDILWFLKSPKRFCSKPTWFHLFGKNIYYMDIYWNDVSTWFTWLWEGLLKFFKSRCVHG